MSAKTVATKSGASKTPRGKRQFLVHVDVNVIRRIKILAIDRNVSASSLVQEALLAYLAATGDSAPTKRNSRNQS